MQKELGHYSLTFKPFSNKTCTNRQPHAHLELRGVKSRSLLSKSDFLPPLFITGNQGSKKSRDPFYPLYLTQEIRGKTSGGKKSRDPQTI